MSPALELHRLDRTDRRVPPSRVVEALDEVEDGKARFAWSLKAVLDEPFPRQTRIEALTHGVVVAIADRRSQQRVADSLAEFPYSGS